MTNKEREELRKAYKYEFCVDDKKAEIVNAMHEAREYIELLQTEMGLSRQEAILFIATLGAQGNK